MRPQFHLMTISTNGPPHDNGQQQRSSVAAFEAAHESLVDSINVLTPEKLAQLDPRKEHLWADHREKVTALDSVYALEYNPRWVRIGFLAWKVLAVIKVFESAGVQNGDFLFYQDSDVSRYPNLAQDVPAKIAWLMRAIRSKDILFLNDFIRPFSTDVRPDLLSSLSLPISQMLVPRPIWAGAFLMRKNVRVEGFLHEWLASCSWDNLKPESVRPPANHFVWHSGEQSLLNCVVFSKGRGGSKKSVGLPRITMRHLWQSRKMPPKIKVRLSIRASVRALVRRVAARTKI